MGLAIFTGSLLFCDYFTKQIFSFNFYMQHNRQFLATWSIKMIFLITCFIRALWPELHNFVQKRHCFFTQTITLSVRSKPGFQYRELKPRSSYFWTKFRNIGHCVRRHSFKKTKKKNPWELPLTMSAVALKWCSRFFDPLETPHVTNWI